LSALLQALYRGDDEQVESLLAPDPELDLFEAAALGNFRAIDAARQTGDARIEQSLLEHGANG
jgi:hypothetical protein